MSNLPSNSIKSSSLPSSSSSFSTSSLTPPSTSSSSADNFDDDFSDLTEEEKYAISLEYEEPPSFADKLWRKTQEDPLVPIGAGVTVAMLVGGVICMGRAKSQASQYFMRGRVVAQAFTLGAVLFAMAKKGLLYAGDKQISLPWTKSSTDTTPASESISNNDLNANTSLLTEEQK